MKNLLILFCLIWITAPAFGQNQADHDKRDIYKSFGVFYEPGYMRVISDDGSEIYAMIQKPELIYHLSFYTPLLKRNQIFGFDPQIGLQLKIADGNVIQNLKPTFDSPDEQWNVEMGGDIRVTYSLFMNFIYVFPKQSNHPLLFNFGFEVANPVDGSYKVYLTHDPNRSAACATAVNNSIANPALSTEAIKANCETAIVSEDSMPLSIHYGVDWVASSHIKLSALIKIPIDIQSFAYRVKREDSLSFAMSFVW